MGTEDCFEKMRLRVASLRCNSQAGEMLEISYSDLICNVELVESSCIFLQKFIRNREANRKELVAYAKMRHNMAESVELKSKLSTVRHAKDNFFTKDLMKVSSTDSVQSTYTKKRNVSLWNYLNTEEKTNLGHRIYGSYKAMNESLKLKPILISPKDKPGFKKLSIRSVDLRKYVSELSNSGSPA